MRNVFPTVEVPFSKMKLDYDLQIDSANKKIKALRNKLLFETSRNVKLDDDEIYQAEIISLRKQNNKLARSLA